YIIPVMLHVGIERRAARLIPRAATVVLALALASCPNEAPTDPPVVGAWASVATGERHYVFAREGTVTLTVLDASPLFLPTEIVSIDKPEPGATYAAGDYVVTKSSHVFLCAVGGLTAAGAASGLEAADSDAVAVGSTIVDGGVTWELVDRVTVHGAWTLDGSTLTIDWTGAGSSAYTLAFYASGGIDRMSMQGLAGGASLTLERSET
ncbi:MAG: hypothetical protein Q8M76_11645, partial [Spirochaetaceae bacterium]|nr:hypothetical protein [Spirochaetaceae bacterium]